MSDLQVIEKKMGEAADAILAVQEKVDALEAKHDGLDLDTLKTAQEVALTAMGEAQDAKTKLASDEAKARYDELVLAMAKGGGSGEEDESEYKHGLTRYMRKGTDVEPEVLMAQAMAHAGKALIGVDDASVEQYAKDLVAGSGPDGGYFVTSDRSNEISRRIFETSPLRGLASIVTTNSDIFEMLLDDDETDAGWVGETQSRPDTDTPQIGLLKIPVHELYAQPRATQKMLDDAGFDIEGWLAGKVERKIGRLENTAFAVGDGSQKPKGLLSYAAWAVAGTYERNKVEQRTATGTAGILDNADDLIAVQNDLIEDYQPGASWGMRRATFGDVMTLKDTQGRYLINPLIIKESTDKVLLGADVTFMSDIPAVANDALAVVYANFSEFYIIVDRFGIRVLRDPYTAKPYTRFYTTKRTGGAVKNFEAGKILKINS